MTEPPGQLLRRGGRGRQADGALLTWSIAEGGRGRRWRATTIVDGILHQALVLETDGARRPQRLEVASNAGLLTLHPDHDERELHGNVVTPDGIRHLRFEWSARHELVAAGMSLVAVAGAWRLGGEVGVGEGSERPAVVVGADLACVPGEVRFERLDGRAWRVRAGGFESVVTCEPDGRPGLDDADEWPLEED
jgi:hypothetical protein